MEYHRITGNERSPVSLQDIERWSTGILREIKLEEGRVTACKDTVKALRERMSWSGSGERR